VVVGTDAGASDAGASDAGASDAGPADAGCGDAGVPPALTVRALPSGDLTLDGDLTEWTAAGWVAVAAPVDFRQDGSRPVADDAADLSARLAARWTSEALWFAVEVTDDVHQEGSADELLWRGDSLQLAFDILDATGVALTPGSDFGAGGEVEGIRPPQPFQRIAARPGTIERAERMPDHGVGPVAGGGEKRLVSIDDRGGTEVAIGAAENEGRLVVRVQIAAKQPTEVFALQALRRVRLHRCAPVQTVTRPRK